MRELIPLATPSNTWRGFAMRVLIIALAASVVLGVAALFRWSLDVVGPSHRPAPRPEQSGPVYSE